MFCKSVAAIAGLGTLAMLASTVPSAAGYLRYHLKRNMVSSYTLNAVPSRSVPVGSVRFRVDGPAPSGPARHFNGVVNRFSAGPHQRRW